MAKITISDVARESGVSLGTVSNALNHPDKVKPGTRALIYEAITRLGYVPNQAARQLAGSESRVLGLALPRLDHAFSLQIANGAQAESRLHGYDLLIASTENDDILENHYMRYFMGAHMAGVLVQPMASTSWKPSLEKTPVPVVYLDVHSSSLKNHVAADNEAQGRLIAEHAIACGARRLAVVGEAKLTQLALRVRGICDVAREAGVGVELIGLGDWNTAQDGFEVGRMLASRIEGERPDFVIGLTDVLAAGIIEGICSVGVCVPDDMLVAGCDGNPLAWGGPITLTTISSPGYEIGRRGVQLLLAEIEGTSSDDMRGEVVFPTLLVRASTTASVTARENVDALDLNLGEYLMSAHGGVNDRLDSEGARSMGAGRAEDGSAQGGAPLSARRTGRGDGQPDSEGARSMRAERAEDDCVREDESLLARHKGRG